MALSARPPGRPQSTSRSTSATIQPNILRYLTSVAEGYGVDLRPLLKQVDLDETVMRSAALRVSYRQGSTVIRRAVELTGDPHLGMKVGAAQHLTSWGLLGLALMADDTLQAAITTGVTYQNLSGAMVMWSAGPADGDFVLRVDLPDPGVDPGVAVFLVEEGLSSVVTLARLTIGAGFRPKLVEFAFSAPQQAEAYEDFFGCPVRCGAPVSRLVIDHAGALTPMPGRDPVTYASAIEMLDQQMSSRRHQQELLEVLEVSIAQSLPAVLSFAEQARRHATSERTLRRRLADCGTTYDAVVDGVRRERVEQLLPRHELTFRDIAHRAGFSDERALRRAVHRWHGTSPLRLRLRLRLRDQLVNGS